MRTGIGTVPVLSLLVAALMLAPRAVVAQGEFDARRQLVLGGPSAVGVLFPISARWSFRADGTVSGTVNGVGNGAGVGPASAWTFGLGASMLRHVPGEGPLRAYLLARVGYQRSISDGNPSSETYQYSAGGGAQIRVHDQAAIFTELTAHFAYATSSSGAYVTSWSTVNRIGLTLRRRTHGP